MSCVSARAFTMLAAPRAHPKTTASAQWQTKAAADRAPVHNVMPSRGLLRTALTGLRVGLRLPCCGLGCVSTCLSAWFVSGCASSCLCATPLGSVQVSSSCLCPCGLPAWLRACSALRPAALPNFHEQLSHRRTSEQCQSKTSMPSPESRGPSAEVLGIPKRRTCPREAAASGGFAGRQGRAVRQGRAGRQISRH